MKSKPRQKVGEERAGFRGDADSYSAPAGSAGAKDWGDDWVHELIHLASGAGEGVFEEEPQPLRDFRL
jgi:hypothetical protein